MFDIFVLECLTDYDDLRNEISNNFKKGKSVSSLSLKCQSKMKNLVILFLYLMDTKTLFLPFH